MVQFCLDILSSTYNCVSIHAAEMSNSDHLQVGGLEPKIASATPVVETQCRQEPQAAHLIMHARSFLRLAASSRQGDFGTQG